MITINAHCDDTCRHVLRVMAAILLSDVSIFVMAVSMSSVCFFAVSFSRFQFMLILHVGTIATVIVASIYTGWIINTHSFLFLDGKSSNVCRVSGRELQTGSHLL